MKYRTAFIRLAQSAICGVLLLSSALTIGFFTPRRWNTAQSCSDHPYQIYVEGDAMHVNLIMPVDNGVYDWQKFLNLEQIGSDIHEDYRYLKMGWGDRIWYTEVPDWQSMNVFDIARVLFKPGNASVMYVQGYAERPKEVRCVGVDREQYLAFVNFVQNSFDHDAQGKLIHLKDGAATTDGFYAATGQYSALRTCNSWSAEALDAAGINTPLWSALAPAVMRQLPN
ncbi:TIGR02117 family protein [Leptolyngbya sp. GGD]|uniref:TIGR02117 family protein n=1 Tax=Leptolyngbya sp. GGD TaxID=2997907 RepID=UPI00227CB9B4|nr:TIGR02117 family protein [Leptolyngbya sp. GGD]MCY6489702.1 TIGR02117 family protein [Leptolyngbya sp. GGD]